MLRSDAALASGSEGIQRECCWGRKMSLPVGCARLVMRCRGVSNTSSCGSCGGGVQLAGCGGRSLRCDSKLQLGGRESGHPPGVLSAYTWDSHSRWRLRGNSGARIGRQQELVVECARGRPKGSKNKKGTKASRGYVLPPPLCFYSRRTAYEVNTAHPTPLRCIALHPCACIMVTKR